MGFVFTFATVCQASVTFSGSLESDTVYMPLNNSAIPAPETIFCNVFNLKAEINPGEKQNGVILLQYKYTIPSDPALTDSLIINQAYSDLQLTSNSLMRIGRQKISWGTGFAWNPTNYIGADKNRADLTAIYPGVDAIDYELTRGQLSGVLLVKPSFQGRFNDWGRAVKLAFQAFHSDFSISAYQQGDTNGYGADFATTWGIFTIYTELAEKTGKQFYIGETDSTRVDLPRPGGQRFLRGVIGALGNFSNNWMAQLEYYYNQEGWNDTEAQIYPIQNKESKFFADQRQHYLFAMVRKGELVEDLAFTAGIFWNIDDQSMILNPMFDYQLGQNTRIALMMFYYGGPLASEFGSQSYSCQYIGKLTLSF
jgi:hypothetical protein